jgi:hypothetical protein
MIKTLPTIFKSDAWPCFSSLKSITAPAKLYPRPVTVNIRSSHYNPDTMIGTDATYQPSRYGLILSTAVAGPAGTTIRLPARAVAGSPKTLSS